MSVSVNNGVYVVSRSGDSNAKNNNTLANDDTLSFPVPLLGKGNGSLWLVEGFLRFTAANATMDILIGWSALTGTTMSWGAVGTTSGTLAGWYETTTASSPAVLLALAGTLGFGSVNGTQGVTIVGHLALGSTPGTVSFMWAQNTTDVGNLVLKANSCFRFTPLA